MTPRRLHSLALASVLALSGCGSTVADGTGGSGGSGGEGSSTTSTGSSDPCAGKSCGDPCNNCPDAAPCAAQTCDADGQCNADGASSCGGCPAFAPPDQSACTPVGIVCEVEDGPIVECRARATCTATGWENEAPGCSSTPPTDPDCPTTMPTGNCDTSIDPGVCGYGDLLCGCSDCFGGPCGGQAAWVCGDAPAPPCPSVAPRLGAACADPDLSCLYGSCSLGAGLAGRTCTSGTWADEGVACPL